MVRANGATKRAQSEVDASDDFAGKAAASRRVCGHVPLVVHILHRLDIGGLENGLVNIINRMPQDYYRHAIICLTGYTGFQSRIRRPDVAIFALNKREGKNPSTYVKLWHLLRKLRPDIAHTRNLPTVDSILVATAAGVPHRVHGEHGRDMLELSGDNRKYNLLRRVCRPFVHTYIPMSHDLAGWLRDKIGVPERKIAQIYNGVDTGIFYPAPAGREPLPVPNIVSSDTVVIGTVGRMASVKDPLTLVRAFLYLLESMPDGKKRLRLALIGDGPLRAESEMLLKTAGAMDFAWVPGTRDDIPELLRGLDIFVLPSLAEGVSNTILEAMASGLPVVATRVGGTPEIVAEGVTGMLVPASDPVGMAQAVRRYVDQPQLRREHGRAARQRIEHEFDIGLMVDRYKAVYDGLMAS